jgi:hypothetical protein
MVKLPCAFQKVVQTSSETTSHVHVRSAVHECEKNGSTSLHAGCIGAHQGGMYVFVFYVHATPAPTAKGLYLFWNLAFPGEARVCHCVGFELLKHLEVMEKKGVTGIQLGEEPNSNPALVLHISKVTNFI